MIDVDLAFPLSAGVVAAFNPCGFAMLPAYLSYFLGVEAGEERSSATSATRGLAVGLTLSAGFVFLFGLVGLLTGTVLAEGFIELASILTLDQRREILEFIERWH